MRRLALLPTVLLLTAIQLIAAEYGSLTRVTVAGTIYTPAPAPRVAPDANGNVTYVERTTTSTLGNADILRAMVARSLIPGTTGYQIGLLKTATLDGLGEFVAYRPAGPASAARRVPTDLLTFTIDTGPREGTIRRNAAEALLAINLTSRDHATLSLLDFEGAGILTQRFTNNIKLKSPQNRVVLISATGTFPGVKAPDTGNNGLGTLTVTFSDPKVVDLAPFGNVAPSTTSSSSGVLTLGGSTSINTGGATLNSGNLSVGSGTTINSGTLTLAGGSTLDGNGTISLNGGSAYTGGTVLNGGTIVGSGGTTLVTNGAQLLVNNPNTNSAEATPLGGNGTLNLNRDTDTPGTTGSGSPPASSGNETSSSDGNTTIAGGTTPKPTELPDPIRSAPGNSETASSTGHSTAEDSTPPAGNGTPNLNRDTDNPGTTGSSSPPAGGGNVKVPGDGDTPIAGGATPKPNELPDPNSGTLGNPETASGGDHSTVGGGTTTPVNVPPNPNSGSGNVTTTEIYVPSYSFGTVMHSSSVTITGPVSTNCVTLLGIGTISDGATLTTNSGELVLPSASGTLLDSTQTIGAVGTVTLTGVVPTSGNSTVSN